MCREAYTAVQATCMKNCGAFFKTCFVHATMCIFLFSDIFQLVLFVAADFHKRKSGYICSSYSEKLTSRSDSCHIHTQNIKLCVQCFATTLLICSILGLASDSVASFHFFSGEYQTAGNEQLSSTVFLTIQQCLESVLHSLLPNTNHSYRFSVL